MFIKAVTSIKLHIECPECEKGLSIVLTNAQIANGETIRCNACGCMMDIQTREIKALMASFKD
jgi:transcription elongation factor Elf1